MDQCAATQSSHGIVVDNGAPSLTAPTAGQEVRDDLLTVAATAPGGSAVRFRLGPETVLDASAPYSAEVPTDRLADGPQQVTARLCRSDGTLCDDAHPSTVAVTVRRLHPAVTRVSRRVFSPDGDGRRDQTRVAFTLDRRASVALVARDLSGAEVFRRSLGSRPAGAHTASWDGRRTGGGQVANGMYTLGVATSDGTLLGRADTPVVVDRRSPRLQDARVSRPRVLPVRDDFQDTVTVSATADEDVRSLRLQVRTTAGALVRTVRAGRETAGAVAVRWNGRRSDGRLVPGTYRVRLVARDRAGNEAESTTQTVVVSSARLVRRTGSLTVTARSSVLETFVDECSEVFRRTRGRHRGWMSYGSGSICTSGDAYAAADHQVRLPQAVRYGTVQVSAYGGRGDRG